jgi:hypothetical protein
MARRMRLATLLIKGLSNRAASEFRIRKLTLQLFFFRLQHRYYLLKLRRTNRRLAKLEVHSSNLIPEGNEDGLDSGDGSGAGDEPVEPVNDRD